MVEDAPKDYFQESTACSKVTNKNDNSSSFQLSCMAHAAALHHMSPVPKFKLISCGIPKVGILKWIKFF
jgi:hypothetical protein